MSDLPAGWAEATLENVTDPVRVICYGILMPKEHVDSGVPYVRVKDFPNGEIVVASLRRTAPEIAAKYPRSRLKTGDVLLSIRGSYGRVAIVPKPLDGANITQDTARIAPMPGIHRNFLAFFLQSAAAQHYFRRVARGVAVKGVNIGDLRVLQVPIPPTAEQGRIVEAIEEQFSRLDDAETSLRSAQQRVDLFRASALMEDFDGAWPTRPLVEVTNPERVICYGILMPKQHVDDGVPYVRVKDFPNGTIEVAGLRRTAPEIADKYKRSSLKSGDVLLSIRGSYGRVASVPDELDGANITQDTARIAPLPEVDASFLISYLRGAPAQRYFARVARGVAVKGVNIGDLRKLPVPVPPLDEQRRIVAEVERQLSIADALETAIDAALRRSATLRRAILDRAFRGTLVPQDPADEPASVLLERIARKRASDQPKRARKKVAGRRSKG